jgi:hypothetical protein
VAVSSGIGIQIENTGSTLFHTPHSSFKMSNILHCPGLTLFHTPHSSFKMSNILHCPQASANLLSIQKFCKDNFCYFILISSNYFIKDLLTHATLLEGRSENGSYPLKLGRNLTKKIRLLLLS